MAKVKDKATAFKNELSGSTTNKIVCKASSHEVAGPKKKHVDYLLQLSSSPNCQMTSLADLVADRLRHNNWVVVFKALIVSHNLMSLGNERYMQCVATKQHMFNLDNFNDRSDYLASDMSVHVRQYARYLGCYAAGYKVMALDVCRVAKGEESPFSTMETGKVLKAAAAIQKQLGCLLEVEVTSSELTNGVINTSFLMLYKDLIKLYTAYNDILINLLDKFFESKKAECKETIDAYRKFLIRQEGVQRYLQLAEEVGVDKQTHKDLRKVPDDLLPALEEHLSEMDSIRKENASQPSPVIKAASEKLSALSGVEPKKPKGLSNNASSGSGVASGLPSASDEILEAQKKRFEELKRQASLIKSSPDKASLSSQESETPKKSSSNDLLGLEGAFSSQPQQQPAAVPQPQTSNTETFNPWGSSAATSSVGNGIPPTQPVTTAVSNNPFQPQATATNASGGGGDPWGAQAQGQSSGLVARIKYYDDDSLICEVTLDNESINEDLEYKWYENDTEILREMHEQLQQQKAMFMSEPKYKCVVVYKRGNTSIEATSNTLTVKRKNIIAMIEECSDGKLLCIVEKNNERINDGLKYQWCEGEKRLEGETDEKLGHNPVSFESKQKYRCEVLYRALNWDPDVYVKVISDTLNRPADHPSKKSSSDEGEEIDASNINGPPSPVKDLSITNNLDDRTVTFMWTYDNAVNSIPATSFTVTVTLVNGGNSITETVSITDHSLTLPLSQLVSEESYRVSVVATNQLGGSVVIDNTFASPGDLGGIYSASNTPSATTLPSAQDQQTVVTTQAGSQDQLEITEHPKCTQEKRCKQKLVLTVRATCTGFSTLTYQWIKNETRILTKDLLPNCKGFTSDSLEFTDLQPVHSGSYKCKVTSSLSEQSVESKSAELKVLETMELKNFISGNSECKDGIVTDGEEFKNCVEKYLQTKELTLAEADDGLRDILEQIYRNAQVKYDEATIDFQTQKEIVNKEQIGEPEPIPNNKDVDQTLLFSRTVKYTKGSTKSTNTYSGWTVDGKVSLSAGLESVGVPITSSASVGVGYKRGKSETNTQAKSTELTKVFERDIHVPKKTQVKVSVEKTVTDFECDVSNVKFIFNTSQEIEIEVDARFRSTKKIKIRNIFQIAKDYKDQKFTIQSSQGKFVWSETCVGLKRFDPIPLQ